MRKLLREPLVHFLLIGAALFVVYALVQPAASAPADDQIVVSAGRVRQLVNVFERTWQRPPTEEELRKLVDDFVLEEIYYRRAVAMGIDRDDTIIRRRLRQKLEFLTDDVANLTDPDEATLQAYLEAHEGDFREPPVYDFRQVYFNPEAHEDFESFVEQQLSSLKQGESVSGDTSLLPESLSDIPAPRIDSMLGIGFAAQLESLALEEWHGPLTSGLGAHLVYVSQRQPGRLPALSEIRDTVEREWSNAQRLTLREQFHEQLRDDYDVVVEWPQEPRDAS